MNKLYKRLLSLAVVMIMVMTMLPTVFAEEPAYTDWDGDAAALVDGACLKLTGDLEVTTRYTVMNGNVTIDLNGKKITSTEAIQFMYITTGGSVTLKNGTIEMPGLAADNSTVMGGLIQANSGAVSLTLDNVTITKTGATTGLTHAAILYSRIPTRIKDSTLQVTATEVGGASQEGGLIKISSGCTLTVDNSTLVGTKAKYGGGIFITGSGKVVVNSGTVTGGTATSYGDDIYATSNAVIEINGGNIGNIYMRGKTATVSGGTLASWTLKSGEMTVGAGVTTYSNPSAVATGCEAYVLDNTSIEGVSQYTTYEKLADALTAAQPGNTVSLLMAEVTAGAVAVPAGVTLNIYGKTLNADSVTAAYAGAQIKDSKGTGKIVSDSVSVMPDNNQLLFSNGNEYTFEAVAFAQNLTVENNAALYKFYIKGLAEETPIDDAILAGEAVAINVRVTWTNGVGDPKEKTFTLDANMLAQYAGNWDTKMITLTINDLTNVTNLACYAQVSYNGVTVEA